MDLNASPLELKQKADDLYAKQDYAAAAEEYRKLVKAQPGLPDPMKALGLSLVLAKQSDEGLQVLKTAAAMMPANAEIRYAYGYGLGTVGQWDESIAELDAALNLQPNHVPARQGVIFALLTSGQALAQVDPVMGEQRLDRAHKLDQKNAHIATALLDFLVQGGQKGKAVNLIKGLDDTTKSQSPLKELLDKLDSDPDYKVHLKQASMTAKPTMGAAPPPPSQTLKQVPCPACGLPIMEYAAICPHCNHRNRATGTFAGMDTGPKYEWQEIAYTVMSLIIIGVAVLNILQVLPTLRRDPIFGKFLLTYFGAVGVIGLGLVFRQEWIAFIAKILFWIQIPLAGLRLMATFFTGHYLAAGLEFLNLAVTIFMLYLINYVMGD